MSFHLVHFRLDNTLYVCKNRDLKRSTNGQLHARFSGTLYEADVLFSHDSEHPLNVMLNELTSRVNVHLDEVEGFSNGPSESDYRSSDESDSEESVSDVVKNVDRIYSKSELSNGDSKNQMNVSKGLPPKLISLDSMYVPKPSGIVQVVMVESAGKKSKKYFCKFCKRSITKLARHLETVHKNEHEVKCFTTLPKGAIERKKIIHLLRGTGSFIHNTHTSFNKGNLQVARRPRSMANKTSDDFLVCPRCKESYSKSSLRRHAKKCMDPDTRYDRSIMVMGRRVRANVHSVASDVLKNKIFPYLREVEVTRSIRYDELIIRFFNEQCLKYRSFENHKMIRAHIRLVGRFFLKLKSKVPCIENICDAFMPKNFDHVLEAIGDLGEFDENLNLMKKPNVPLAIGTLLRKLAEFCKSFSILKEDYSCQKNADNFLTLIGTHFNPHISQTVNESKLYFARQKKIEIPLDEDVHKLILYLLKNIRDFFDILTQKYDQRTWLELASFSLLWIICFNRRRVGEVERMKIIDFEGHQRVDKFADAKVYNSLSLEGKKAAEDFIRVQLRGKLGRTVPLLLCRLVFSSISLLIKHRGSMGVPELNPYVFGLPGLSRNRYIDACSLLREHSVKCGAAIPNLLRGTTLRKHIATKSVLLNLNDGEISDLANYMGHAEKIHRSHYRLPIVAREITDISKILLKAQGADDFTPDYEDFNVQGIQADLNVTSKDIVDGASTPKSNSAIMFWPTTKKVPWSTPEKEAVKKIFGQYLSLAKTPYLKDCHKATQNCPQLKQRSPQSIKTWISNYIRKEDYQSGGSVRKPWTTPEKEALNKHFACNYELGKLPSLSD